MKSTIVFERLMLPVSFRERLRHQPGLEPDLHFAHLALDLGLRRQRRDRVDHDDVHGAGSHQHVGDFERLFAGIRLRNQQFLGIDAEFSGVDRVERVLGVHEGGHTAQFLRLGDDRECERRLARGFRPVNLDHAAARHATDAERDVEGQRSGGYDFDVVVGRVLAEEHHRALAELLVDLAQRRGESLLAIVFHRVSSP